MTCTFFGHRDTPKEKEPILKSTLINLIEKKSVDTFYVGNNGSFDKMVYSVLSELSYEYPIKFFIVLSRLPKSETECSEYTVLPDGIEAVPPRFAITYRNKWMIEHSDYVIAYVNRPWGGASKFTELSQKKKKAVINIASEQLYF